MSYSNNDKYIKKEQGCCFCTQTNSNNENYMNNYVNTCHCTQELETMYPYIYTIINPMVVSACCNVIMPMTKESLDQMANNIYDKAVTNNRLNVAPDIYYDNRQRRPHYGRNRFLKDLITILILRELIGRY